VFLTSSCEKQMLVIIKCSECVTEEPGATRINIRLSTEPLLFNSVSINIYEGDNTNGQLINTIAINSGGEININVALNRTYTLEAIYSTGTRTYRVYDSARPLVKYSESDCEEPCYYVYNNTADLRLKYL
jgi:hypothetical protein